MFRIFDDLFVKGVKNFLKQKLIIHVRSNLFVLKKEKLMYWLMYFRHKCL